MQLVKCTITKPALFDNKQLDFSSGITFVKGKNGAGKSFIIKAFTDALFGYFSDGEAESLASLKDIYLDLCFKITPDSVASYRFRYQNDNLTVFKINEESGEEQELGRISPESKQNGFDVLEKSGDEILAKFLRSCPRDEFVNICYVPSPSALSAEDSVNQNIMRDIVLSDELGFYDKFLYLKYNYGSESTAQTELHKAIAEQQRTLNELNKEIEIIHLKNQRFYKLEQEENSVTAELEKIKEDADNFKQREETLNTLLGDMDSLEEMNEKLVKLKEQISLEKAKISEIKSIEADEKARFHHFDFTGLAGSKTEDLDGIQWVFTELINNNEKLGRLKTWIEQKKKRFKTLCWLAVLWCVAAGLLLLGETDGWLPIDLSLPAPPLYLFVGGGAFVFLLLLYGLFKRAQGKKKFALLAEEKAGLNTQLQQMLKDNSFQVDDYKLSELYDILLKYFEEYTGYSDNRQEIDGIRAELSDPSELKDISDEVKILSKQRDKLQKSVKDRLKAEGFAVKETVSKINVSALADETRGSAEELLFAAQSKEDLLARIQKEKSLSVNEDDSQAILQRDKAKSSLMLLTDKKETISFITNIMTDAVKEREKQQTKKLVDDALTVFHRITANQLKGSIDESTVENFIAANGHSGELNPATVHMLLLSVKLALTGFSFGSNARLPLLIDDPFLFMDDDRIRRLMEQLKETAKTRQVVVFTHRVPDDCAEKVIEL